VRLELVVSCEHGGNRVPARYAPLFAGAARELDSHAGWDPGAATLARELARNFAAPLSVTTATRLLVDVNRSADNPRVFSRWTRDLPSAERERILDTYWRPHREAVRNAVERGTRDRATVVHVSAHSFTPVWKGVARDVDVGFLYDPARAHERAFVFAWAAALERREPRLRVRKNRPYSGTTDGLTTTLRAGFGATRYFGIELEVSQRITRGEAARWQRLRRSIEAALRDAIA